MINRLTQEDGGLGFDRYPSVLADLAQRRGALDETRLAGEVERIFRTASPADLLDVRGAQEKQRLFSCKENVWTKFGYSLAYLEDMKTQSFWEREYRKIGDIDASQLRARASQAFATQCS